MTPLSSGLQSFCWKICWLSCGDSLVCDKSLFSCCLQNSLQSFIIWLCVTMPISLCQTYLGVCWILGPKFLFHSPDLRSFKPLFLWIIFLFLSNFYFCSYNAYMSILLCPIISISFLHSFFFFFLFPSMNYFQWPVFKFNGSFFHLI